MSKAPIVLFVYNRLDHTKLTVEALKKNYLVKESDLFIYSDAAEDINSINEVNNVREFINKIVGFKSINIIEQKTNKGLANSIIDGVTEIINRFGKVIVLEDDIVTSQYFLTFMNDALDFYENEDKVWHISGWNYPKLIDDINYDVYLWRLMNCWGWATWKNKWKYYEKNISHLVSSFSKLDIKSFNLNNSEFFWHQVLGNKKNIINTWAIFWYATIFKNSGLCLNPCETLVQNIGHDGSGINCSTLDVYNYDISKNTNFDFDIPISENLEQLENAKAFYKNMRKTFIQKLWFFCMRIKGRL